MEPMTKISSQLVEETSSRPYEHTHDATVSLIAEYGGTTLKRVYSCSSDNVPQVIGDRIGEFAEFIWKSGEDLVFVQFRVSLGVNPYYPSSSNPDMKELGR